MRILFNRLFSVSQACVSMMVATLLGCAAQPVDSATTVSPSAVNIPAEDSFHIYLLMGQSNMVGRDTRTLAEQKDNPRILALNGDGKWLVAREPMHVRGTGVGPGIPFASEMLKLDPNVTIGLVPCAVGGTSLKRWVKGADLYERAVSRAKLAAQAGLLKGVLWHQGETDSEKQANAEGHEEHLKQMFADLRQDLNAPDLPIIVGQLGTFLSKEKYPHADDVRTAIINLAASIPAVGYADSTGLTDKGDRLHFSAEAEAQLGMRFARALQNIQEQQSRARGAGVSLEKVVPLGALGVFAVWPEGKMPGSPATEAEADRPPKGDNILRITNISHPTATVFPASKKNAPAMIVSPGGGYGYVVYDKEGVEVAAWLNSIGMTAVVLKYRVPNNRAGAMQDIQRALSLARTRAAEWNVDPKRLGVMGFSAGGHLSARASTAFDERAYSPIDDIDQQSCRPDFAVLVYPAYLGKDGQVAAELKLKANVPPTLLLQAEDDKNFVAGTKIYRTALSEAGVRNDFILYPSGGHGYGLRCTKEARAWPEAALGWLRKNGFVDR
ncbi:MAG: sialate O-acetylesterase [Nibricoccus sp.]